MKEATDAVGNPLFQGALVAMKVGDQVLVGHITNYSGGGIALATGGNPKPQQTPGQLLINVNIPLVFEPGARIGVLYLLVDPNAQAALEKAAKAAASASGSDKPFVVPGANE